MAVAGTSSWSLRLEQAEVSRLARAFAISLACHLLVFGSYYSGRKLGWWEHWQWPAWMQSHKLITDLLKQKATPQPPPVLREPPLMFVDVSPAQAAEEAPKDAKYYSSRNSRAANPDLPQDQAVPQIHGEQTQVVKTEDVAPQKFTPLQPALPAKQAQEEQAEVKPKPKSVQPPGDLAMVKPDTKPVKDPGDAENQPPKPRTLKEAMLRHPERQVPGQKMKQEGGVRQHALVPSFDVKGTVEGAYDSALVEAIAQCWYGLLEQQQYASDYRGKVVLHFVLHYDGTVSELAIAENTAGSMAALLCQTAVDKPRPYGKFPPDMRHRLGDTRNIQFTFYYN